jgi:signal transduction histidine kinase
LRKRFAHPRFNTPAGKICNLVKDDGQGLRKDFGKSQGMGQKIMRHRAETIGATLDIRNHPKGGVIMACTLPAAQEPLSAHRRVSR